MKNIAKTWAYSYPRIAFLLAFGVGYLGLGFTWIAFPSSGRLSGVNWLPVDLDERHVGFMWIAAGLVALVAGFYAPARPRAERIGFFALQFVPLLLTLWFAIAFLLAFIPPDGDGNIRAATYVFAYALLFVAAWLVSGMRGVPK